MPYPPEGGVSQEEVNASISSAVSAAIAAINPLVYRGTIGTGGDFTTFPAANRGDFVIALAGGEINDVPIRQGYRYMATADNTAAGNGDNWIELGEPQFPAPQVMQSQATSDIALNNQLVAQSENAGFLTGAPLFVQEEDGIRGVSIQRTQDDIWNSGFDGSERAEGTQVTATYTIRSTSSGVLTALGFAVEPLPGETEITGVKVRISQGAGNIMAWSPSQAIYDDDTALGLDFNTNRQTIIWVPLDRGFLVGTSESFVINIRWTRGIFYHADDSFLAPTYFTRARINNGDAERLVSRADIAGITSSASRVTFDRPVRVPKVIDLDDNAQLLMRGNILGYRGQGYDTIVPWVDRTTDQSITRSLSIGGGSAFTVTGDGTPLAPVNNEIIINAPTMRQSMVRRISVRQVVDGLNGQDTIEGCNLRIRMTSNNVARVVFDLQLDTGETFTLLPAGQETVVFDLEGRAGVPLIDTTAESTTVNVEFIIIVPNNGLSARIENLTTGTGATRLIVNPATIANIQERRPPFVINSAAGQTRVTTPDENGRYRYANRVIVFAGAGDHTFNIPNGLFESGTKMEFHNTGSGTASIVLAEPQRFGEQDDRTITLADNEYASYVLSAATWYRVGRVSDSAGGGGDTAGPFTTLANMNTISIDLTGGAREYEVEIDELVLGSAAQFLRVSYQSSPTGGFSPQYQWAIARVNSNGSTTGLGSNIQRAAQVTDRFQNDTLFPVYGTIRVRGLTNSSRYIRGTSDFVCSAAGNGSTYRLLGVHSLRRTDSLGYMRLQSSSGNISRFVYRVREIN